MDDEQFNKCTRTWINILGLNIGGKAAQVEDVELMLAYFCHLFESNEEIPREVLSLLNQIFREYLKRKANKQIYGSMDAAFGLTRKQGDRNLDQKNMAIAADVARHHLGGKSITNSVIKVMSERKLGRTTVYNAWTKNKYSAFRRVENEYRDKGKPITDKQKKLMKKEKERFDQFLKEFLRNTKK